MWWVEQVELSESLEHITTLTDGLVALPQNGWCVGEPWKNDR